MIVKLGDVATYINGYAFKPSDWSTNGLPIIRIQDLTGNSYQCNRYNGEYDEKYEIVDGDVLISWSASLGVYVWKGEKSVLNQHIFKVVFDKCEIDKNFFVHQVANILEKAEVEAHGATMKHLTKKVFDSLPFYLPPLEEQKKIAETLDKVSDLIAKRKQQIEKLDLLVKSRFVEMFEDNDYNYQDLISLIIDGMGLSYGIVQPGEDGTGDMGVIRPVDIFNGKILKNQIKYIDRQIGLNYSKTELSGSEILITVRGTTGLTALTTNEFIGMNVTRGIAVIRYNSNKINPIYLNEYLKCDKSQRYIQENTKGATLKQINLSELRKLMVLVPPLELQKQFADFVQQVEKTKTIVIKSLEKLETLKKALTQEYFG